MRFELSAEEREIVDYLLEDKWVVDDESETLKKFDLAIDNLKSPEALFEFCVNFNFDCGVEELLRLLCHDLMDKGTVLAMYWIMGPGYFMQYERRDEVEYYEIEQLEAIEAVAERLEEIFQSEAKIKFDPRNDDGYDWTKQYKRDMEKLAKSGKRSFLQIPPKYYEVSTHL